MSQPSTSRAAMQNKPNSQYIKTYIRTIKYYSNNTKGLELKWKER